MRVDVEICVEMGAGRLPDAVESGIRSRIAEQFLSMVKGQTVFRSALLSAAQSVEGVVLAELVRPREDVLVPAGETAILGRFLCRTGSG